jgi:two-component system, response regulator RegA
VSDERDPATSPSMLIVDDDQAFRTRLGRAFTERGYDVRSAGGSAEALALARADSPEMAIVDLRMPPGPSGLELVRDLKAIDPATRILVLTGYGSIATAVDAMRIGATYYLAKPADVDDILTAFARGEAPPLDPPPAEYAAPSLARAEWEHISRVLSDCGGSVSEAARRLGLHRRSLQRKLQKYPPKR